MNASINEPAQKMGNVNNTLTYIRLESVELCRAPVTIPA